MHVELAMFVALVPGLFAMGMGLFGLLAMLVAFLGVFVPLLALIVMRLERAALAEMQLFEARRIFKFDDGGLAAQCFQRLFEKGFQPVADPEHDVRILQRRRIGGF